MSDIHQWFAEKGLGQYADAFEENDITPELLTDPNDQTLKDIGVSSAGRTLKSVWSSKKAICCRSGNEPNQGGSNGEPPS